MKKKDLRKLVIAGLTGALLLSGCGDTKVDRAAVSGEENGSEKQIGEVDEKTQALAEELLTRHVTENDSITRDVIAATIEKLKETYDFEELDTLYVPPYDWNYFGQSQGWDKDLFGDSGIKVEIVEGAEGHEVELMASGQLHFGARMLYPYLLYKAQGADIVAVNISNHPSKEIVSVQVKADSGIESMEDLKGKKIACWRNSCPYMVLLEKTEGMGWKEGTDWTFENIAVSDMKTALLSDLVDAVVYHPVAAVNQPIIHGETVEIDFADPEGLYVNGGGATVSFTSTEFAKNAPNIVYAYSKLVELEKAYEVLNEDEASAAVEKINRVPADSIKLWIDRQAETYYLSSASLDGIKQEISNMEDYLVEIGDLTEETRPDLNELFDESYFSINLQ